MTVNSDRAVAAIQAAITSQANSACIGKDLLTAGSVAVPTATAPATITFAFTYLGTTYSSSNTVAWGQFLTLMAGTSLPDVTALNCPATSTTVDCSAIDDVCTISSGTCTFDITGDTGALVNPTSTIGAPCAFSPDGIIALTDEAVFNL